MISAPNEQSLECVILIGLPGAGKTTFYRERFAATHRQVSKDLWPTATAREARQQKMLAEAFAAGAPTLAEDSVNSSGSRSRRIDR